MTTTPHKGDRLEALLKRLPPLKDNPEFAANVVGILRRGHLVRAGVIAGSVLAGLAAMLALVPFDLIREVLSFLGNWSGGVNFIDLLAGSGEEGPLSVDEQTIERLRALGYVQ